MLRVRVNVKPTNIFNINGFYLELAKTEREMSTPCPKSSVMMCYLRIASLDWTFLKSRKQLEKKTGKTGKSSGEKREPGTQ